MSLYRFDELVEDTGRRNGGVATNDDVKRHWQSCGCPIVYMSFDDFDTLTSAAPDMWTEFCVKCNLLIAVYHGGTNHVYFMRHEDIVKLITE